jgi:hypothetical protein
MARASSSRLSAVGFASLTTRRPSRTRSSAPATSTRSISASSANKAPPSATSTSVLEAANFPVSSSVRRSSRSSARSMNLRLVRALNLRPVGDAPGSLRGSGGGGFKLECPVVEPASPHNNMRRFPLPGTERPANSRVWLRLRVRMTSRVLLPIAAGSPKSLLGTSEAPDQTADQKDRPVSNP